MSDIPLLPEGVEKALKRLADVNRDDCCGMEDRRFAMEEAHRAVAAALLREAAARVNWASVTIYEHGCPACDFKQKHSHACFEAESKHLREIYELVRAQAAALEAGETGK